MGIITRRDFMKGTLALGGTACCAAAFGSLGSNVAYAQSGGGNGKIFVVVHLDGGNDWHQSFDVCSSSSARAAYESTHPVSKITANLVRPTSGGYGLHPSLEGLHSSYTDGDVRILRRVGVNNPSRSHGSEQLKYENGDSNGLGWMGRVMDNVAEEQGNVSRFLSMAIGQGNPVDIQGSKVSGFGVNDIASGLNSQISSEQLLREETAQRVLTMLNSDTQMLGAAIDGQKGMYESLDILAAASSSFDGRPISNTPTLGVHYPSARPGPQLRQIAMLVRGGVGTQLALCGYGGFDLHNNIGNEVGSEANRMRDLDFAFAAFRADMVQFGVWNNVVLAVDSEFGRTIQENGNAGTDHGKSIALVMAGGAINGGVTGTAVSGDEFMRNNNRPNWINVQYHYANAYKEILGWAGLPTNGVFGEHDDFNFNLV